MLSKAARHYLLVLALATLQPLSFAQVFSTPSPTTTLGPTSSPSVLNTPQRFTSASSEVSTLVTGLGLVSGVALHPLNSKLYTISPEGAIREINIVTQNVVVLRNGTASNTLVTAGCADGTVENATFQIPQGMAADKRYTGDAVLYICDAGGNNLRKLDFGQNQVTTLDTGVKAYRDVDMQMVNSHPMLYVAKDNQIFSLNLTDQVTRVLSGNLVTIGSQADGPLDIARVKKPFGVRYAQSTQGPRVYFTDTGTVRYVNVESRVTYTMAGGTSQSNFGYRDGAFTISCRLQRVNEELSGGLGISSTGTNPLLYTFGNKTKRLRVLDNAPGQCFTVAGKGTSNYIDGSGTRASFGSPAGIEVFTAGSTDIIFLAEKTTGSIRVISASLPSAAPSNTPTYVPSTSPLPATNSPSSGSPSTHPSTSPLPATNSPSSGSPSTHPSTSPLPATNSPSSGSPSTHPSTSPLPATNSPSSGSPSTHPSTSPLPATSAPQTYSPTSATPLMTYSISTYQPTTCTPTTISPSLSPSSFRPTNSPSTHPHTLSPSFSPSSSQPTKSPRTKSPSSSSPSTPGPTHSPSKHPHTKSPTPLSSTSPSTVAALKTFNPSASPTARRPEATGARLSGSLTKIIVTFSIGTNQPSRADLGCSYLLTSSSVAQFGVDPVCYWSQPSHLVIKLGKDFTVEVDAAIGLKPGVIRNPSATSAAAEQAQLVVRPPPNPTVPVAVVSGKSEYGNCDNAVDISASESQGRGGKPFRYQWTYMDQTGGVGNIHIQTILNQTRSRLVIDTQSFTVGSHMVSLRVTNWIGMTSAAANFSFRIISDRIPVIIIPGSIDISHSRTERLIIRTQIISALSCGNDGAASTTTTTTSGSGGSTTNALLNTNGTNTGVWSQLLPTSSFPPELASRASTITSDVITIPRPISTKLEIPPDKLTMGKTYAFQLTATTRENSVIVGSEARQVFFVEVQVEDVVAVLPGGNTRQLPVLATTHIARFDAKASYDPAGTSVPLVYSWSLRETATNSTITTPPPSSSKPWLLEIDTQILVANGTYVLELTVEGRTIGGMRRFGSRKQTITTTAVNIPDIQVSMRVFPAPGTRREQARLAEIELRANPDDKISLVSNTPRDERRSYSFAWRCLTNNFDFNDRSKLRAGSQGSSLVISPNSLQGGVGYTFEATITELSTGYSSTNEISFTVNAPPSLGSCYSSPSFGLALSTTFVLSCSGWEDTDTPLLYSFYSFNGRQFTALTRRRMEPSFSTLLPPPPELIAGTSSNNASALVRVSIIDALGAKQQSRITVWMGLPDSDDVSVDSISESITARLAEGDADSAGILILSTASYLRTGSESNVTERRLQRSRLLTDLGTLATLASDTEEDSIETPVAILEDLTIVDNAADFPVEQQTIALALVENITDSDLNSFSDTVVASSIGTLSNILSLAQAGKASDRMSTGSSVLNILEKLSTGSTSANLVEGEEALEYTSGEITLASQLVSPTSIGETGSMFSSSNGYGLSVSAGTSLPLNVSGGSLNVMISTTSSAPIYPSNDSRSTAGSVTVVLGQDGKGLDINGIDPPLQITIPAPTLGNSSSSLSPSSVISPKCTFWNTTLREYSDAGLTFVSNSTTTNGTRVLVCNTTHLTTFHGETETSVNVNEISEDDLTEPEEIFSPISNPVFAFCFSLLLSLPLAAFVAYRNDSRKQTEEAVKYFWKRIRFNTESTVRRERSWALFRKHFHWQMKRGHVWLAVLIHPNGDFLDGIKRTVMLYTLLFNSFTVCTLLVGQRQQVPFLSSMLSASLVAMVLAFPIPYFTTMFLKRKIPSTMAIDLSTLVARQIILVKFLLFLFTDIDLGMLGGGGDAEAAGGEAGDIRGDMKLAGDAGGGGGLAKGLDLGDRADIRVAGDAGGGGGRARGFSVAAGAVVGSTCCGTFVWKTKQADNLTYTVKDVVTLSFCVLVMVGCTFINSVLAARLGLDSFEAILVALISFCEDFFVRINAIFWVQMIFFSPLCAFCCCCCSSWQASINKRDSVELQMASTMIAVGNNWVPGKEVIFEDYKSPALGISYHNCMVTEVKPGSEAESEGVQIGWQIGEICGLETHNDAEIDKELKQLERRWKQNRSPFSVKFTHPSVKHLNPGPLSMASREARNEISRSIRTFSDSSTRSLSGGTSKTFSRIGFSKMTASSISVGSSMSTPRAASSISTPRISSAISTPRDQPKRQHRKFASVLSRIDDGDEGGTKAEDISLDPSTPQSEASSDRKSFVDRNASKLSI